MECVIICSGLGLCMVLGVLLLFSGRISRGVAEGIRKGTAKIRQKTRDGFPENRLRQFSFLKKQRQKKQEWEICDAISFLRNLIIIGEGNLLSADSILEQLSARRGSLAPVYGRMLRLLRQNQKKEALECFAEETDSEMGKDFARILLQWDEVDPRMLMETLLSYQKATREKRVTELKKRDEWISDLIYLPAVLNVVLIFINFIYVGYFISQKDLFEMFL